jgi:uncharacterized protein (TIGR02246 family)
MFTSRKIRRGWVLAMTLLCALLPLQASAQPAEKCTKAGEDMIARQFDRWNLALASGNPDTVARLYAADAVLQLAPSQAPIVGRAAIRAHFAGFLGRHAQGTLTMRSIAVSCNAGSDTGTFAYRLTGKRKGTRMVVTGRYSTFYEFRDGDWVIVRHHDQPFPAGSIGIASR